MDVSIHSLPYRVGLSSVWDCSGAQGGEGETILCRSLETRLWNMPSPHQAADERCGLKELP